MPKELTKVSDPQKSFLESREQFNLFLAGIGSGKTHVMAMISARFIISAPHVKGFIGANTYGQLSKATLARITEVWESVYDIKRGRDYVVDIIPPESWPYFGTRLTNYKGTISFNNGCLILLGSLENYKAIDGTEFSWALLDETKDTKEEAVKEVITARMRQTGMWVKNGNVLDYDDGSEECKGYNPLYVFTSPAKVDWLNKWFDINDNLDEISRKIFSKETYYHKIENNKCVVISSTYHNENNLPKGFIQSRVDVWEKSMVDMLIYGSPIAKSGGEWFSRFERTKHVRECNYNPELPLHITFDFNVVPYMSLLVAQYETIDGRGELRIIDEYALESPKNTTEDCCIQFMYDYGSHKSGLFYYGDPSGKNRTTLTNSIRHNYDVVEDVLDSMLNNASNRVLYSAPSLARCRDFCGRIMAGSFHFDMVIDPKCQRLIADCEFLKEGVNGGYVKKRTTDKHTGVSYEKYGHHADAWRYLVVSMFEDDYADFV